MADWRSRLVVSVDGNVVTPIDSLTPSLTLATEVLHSIEASHIGFVTSPSTFSFSLTVKAIGPSAAMLTRLALDGTEFSIEVQEAPGSSGDWSFKTLLFSRCVFTSANPTSASVQGAPSATFSGVSLEFTSKDAQGAVSLP